MNVDLALLLGLVLSSVQLLMDVDLHAARASSRARAARRQGEVRSGQGSAVARN